MTTLPLVLLRALLADVITENATDPNEKKLDAKGREIMLAKSINGIAFNNLNLSQIRMLCAQWKIKKYRSQPTAGCLMLIAQSMQLQQFYKTQSQKVKSSKDIVQASKMRLINVIFSDDFYDDIISMNDSMEKAKLDAGKAANNKRLWSGISDNYNDSLNDITYNVFAFIEDKHVQNFGLTYDLAEFEKINWVKAATWFKETIKDYDTAMVKFSASGTHQPDFLLRWGEGECILLSFIYPIQARLPPGIDCPSIRQYLQ